jgi:hypothetical protein
MNECIIVLALLSLLIATDPAPGKSDFPRLPVRTNLPVKIKGQALKETPR